MSFILSIVIFATHSLLNTPCVDGFIPYPSFRTPTAPLFLSAYEVNWYDFGVCNIPGVDWKRPSKVNQDAWFRHDDVDQHAIVGVLDGHGTHGHELSDYFAASLPSEFLKQLNNSAPSYTELERRIENLAGFKLDTNANTEFETALIHAFHGTHWNAMSNPDLKTGRNGATCIVCCIEKETKSCSVAFVGDSRAICIRKDGIHVVAEETAVNLPHERQRIENGEGSIRGKNVFYGPVGIAMTRALGDAVLLRAGVVPTPVVNTFQLSDGDVLVLATDGVWDVLTNQDVRVIIENHGKAHDASEAIASEARKRWIGELPIMDEAKADDITVMECGEVCVEKDEITPRTLDQICSLHLADIPLMRSIASNLVEIDE
eukprot:scaffold3031_cov102-Cylindrotheca_fusiformis.AAC.8